MTHTTPAQARLIAEDLELGAGLHRAVPCNALRSLADQLEAAQAKPTVAQATATLVATLCDLKGWMHDYADAVVGDFVDMIELLQELSECKAQLEAVTAEINEKESLLNSQAREIDLLHQAAIDDRAALDAVTAERDKCGSGPACLHKYALIDSLTAELSHCKGLCASWTECISDGGWIDDLRKERDAYKLDAGRLNWLEVTNQQGHYYGIFHGNVLTRAAIDAAIAKEAK